MLTEHFARALKRGSSRPLEYFCIDYRDPSYQEQPAYYAKIQVVGWIHSPNLTNFPNLNEILKGRIALLQSEEVKQLPEASIKALFTVLAAHETPESLVSALALNELPFIKQNISLLEKEKNECLQLLYWMFGPNSQKIFFKKSQIVKLQIMLMRYVCIIEKDRTGKVRRPTFLTVLREWSSESVEKKELYKKMEKLFLLTECEDLIKEESYPPPHYSPVRFPQVINQPTFLDLTEQGLAKFGKKSLAPCVANSQTFDPDDGRTPEDSHPKIRLEESFEILVIKRTAVALGSFRLKLSESVIERLLELFKESHTDTLRMNVLDFAARAEEWLNPNEAGVSFEVFWALARRILQRFFIPAHQEVYNHLEGAYLYSQFIQLFDPQKHDIDLEWPLIFFEGFANLSTEERNQICTKLHPIFKNPSAYISIISSAIQVFNLLTEKKLFTRVEMARIVLNLICNDILARETSILSPNILFLAAQDLRSNLMNVTKTLALIEEANIFMGRRMPHDLAFHLLIDAPLPEDAYKFVSRLETWGNLVRKCSSPLLDKVLIKNYLEMTMDKRHLSLFSKDVLNATTTKRRQDFSRIVVQTAFFNPDYRAQLFRFPGLHLDLLHPTQDDEGMTWSSVISLSEEFGTDLLVLCSWVPRHVSKKYHCNYGEGIYWVFEATLILWGKTHTVRIPMKIPEKNFQNDKKLSELYQQLVNAICIENYDVSLNLPENYPSSAQPRAVATLQTLGNRQCNSSFVTYVTNGNESAKKAFELFEFLLEVKLKIRALSREFANQKSPEKFEDFFKQGHLYPLQDLMGWSLFPQGHAEYANPHYRLTCYEVQSHLQALHSRDGNQIQAPYEMTLPVPLQQKMIDLNISIKVKALPFGDQNHGKQRWKHFEATAIPSVDLGKTLEEEISIPIDCREERAKEMIALLLMRLKVRYYQLFHRPKEYEWFLPPKKPS